MSINYKNKKNIFKAFLNNKKRINLHDNGIAKKSRKTKKLTFLQKLLFGAILISALGRLYYIKDKYNIKDNLIDIIPPKLYNSIYYYNMQPLEYAIKTGNIQKIEYLLEKYNFNDLFDYDSEHPLKIAYDYEDKIVELLLKNGINPIVIIDEVMKDRDFKVLKMIFKYNKKLRNDYRFTPENFIFDAVKNDDIDLLVTLIDSGVDLNINNNSGYTVLDIAIEMDNEQMVSILEDNGAKRGSTFWNKIWNKEFDIKSIKDDYKSFMTPPKSILSFLYKPKTMIDYYYHVLNLNKNNNIKEIENQYEYLKNTFSKREEYLKLFDRAYSEIIKNKLK